MQRMTRFAIAFFLLVVGATLIGYGSMSMGIPAGSAAALFAVYFAAIVAVIGFLLPRPAPPTPPAKV